MTSEVTERLVLVAASASARLAAAQEWLGSRSGALLVAPTRGAADDLVRPCARIGRGLFGVHRLTLRQLAADLSIFELAQRGRVPVSSLAATALAARAGAVCAAEGSLGYYEPVVAFPGFARAAARTLEEIRAEQVGQDALSEVGVAGADLARLEAGLADAERRWLLASEAQMWSCAIARLTAGGHRLAGLPLLLIDVTPRTGSERRLVRALAEAAPSVLATVVRGDQEALAALQEAVGGRVRELDSGVPETRLQRLRRDVFDGNDSAGLVTDDSSVTLLSAPGEGRECVELTREMQRLAGTGIAFDRMAVLLRDPDSYLPLLEEALERASIPAYLTRGTVRPHPGGRALLALLACAAEDCSASRFAEYLSLGQVPTPDAAGAPRRIERPWVEPAGDQLVFKTLELEAPPPAAAGPDDPDAPVAGGSLRTPRRWEQMLVDAAVVGGRDRWERRLTGLRAELELRMRELDEDDSHHDYLANQVEGLWHLERFALPVIERLAALPEQATWGEWLRQLAELAAMTLQRPEPALGVLAELEPMEEVGPAGLDEVRTVLQGRLSLLRSEPEGHRYGKVFVATIEEARGRAFDVVFLPGLAEGIFPKRAFEDPLLLDAQRQRIDPALPTQSTRNERERLLLRIAVGAAEERLVVSYPTLDTAQGRARVPSFYALDVLRASEGALPSLPDLKARAASGSSARVGWPAPRQAADAVDVTEFDISYLVPFLTGARSDGELSGIRGRARFLLETNQHLARSLRTRWQRWNRSFWPADGLVDPDEEALEAIRRHRPVHRSFSPTALQQYAACPYRFLLYAVHRLRPREEPVPLEQMDPLTRGSLFHEVQYNLFVELRDTGNLPITQQNRDRVMAIADRLLEAEASDYADKLAPAIARVWNSEISGISTDLRGWIREVADAGERWQPTYFEFAFGLGRARGRDPLSHRDEAVVLDGYRLRGSIDLVERDPERDAWRVTDHKTGRAPRERFLVLKHGEVLQPLLYALAAEYHLDGSVETGRLSYCTRRGDYETRDVELNSENRSKIGTALGIVDRALASGFLPAAPRPRACEWCDFVSVCGPYEQIRLRGKDHSRLADLEQLRGAP